jgi:mannan endo-1,4-beta-mannosidase
MIVRREALVAPWRATVLACIVLVAATVGASAEGVAIGAKRGAILAYVNEVLAQKKTIAGVEVNEFETYLDCTSADYIVGQTGKRPALIGLELMTAIAYPPYAAYLTDRAATQTAAGGLVTMAWHQRNPVEVCPRGEFYECAKKAISAETLQAVLTAGTIEHKLWQADVDAIAKILKDWQARGIVVLFRPYHEMNGSWFWWGQKDAYPQLWDALYDELVVNQKLDNLIWVWSGDRDVPDAKRYYPLRHKPDVVGIDVYEHDPDSAKYAAGRANLAAVAGATPFALTEVGIIPSGKVIDAVNPAWVLLWGGEYLNANWAWNNDCADCNKPEQVAAFFKLDRLVTLDTMPAALRATIAAGVTNDHPLHKANPSCPAKLY